jgi:hypothetical protein
MRPVSDIPPSVEVQDDASYSSQCDSNNQQSYVTVFFRLTSYDSSPSQLGGHQGGSQPLTPLHTPFIQSPATSPNMKISGMPDAMAYGPGVPMIPPPTQGVYYSSAPLGPHQFYPSGPAATNGEEAHFIKQRALSAEIHHSPHFHYQPPAHRLSFSIPPPTDKDGLSYVSAEMLLSAMPERYDD